MLKSSRARFYTALACFRWLLLTSTVTVAPLNTASAVQPEPAAKVLRIAAASDLRDALSAVTAEFRQQQPHITVELVFGSSGKLSQQIQHGAPFDLYIAADRLYADQLWQQGFTEQAPVLLAKGHLVLVTRQGLVAAQDLAELAQPRFRYIAIAEPQHAPYGDRARQALQQSGLWQQLGPKIVYGENVAKTWQLVQSGAADAALVALSLLQKPNQSQPFPVISQALHQPLVAAIVLLKNPARASVDANNITVFYRYLQQKSVTAQLELYGFSTL